MLKDLIKKNRSYRRFYENILISREDLCEFINLARMSASAANRQTLKYFISNDENTNNLIFSFLGWAGYLENWPGPKQSERPSAYIIILHDNEIYKKYWCDPGIAAQSILLGVVEKGLGGCIIASIKREELKSALKIDQRFDILYVLAIGKPNEKVVIEEVNKNGDIKYWRDNNDIHHVPKRSLKEIIIN